MKTLYANGVWWEDSSAVDLLVEDRRVVSRSPGASQADETIDLDGRTLMPGFFDCHLHILSAGLDLQRLDIGDCRTRKDVSERIREEDARLAPGEWLQAVQYDANRFADGREITAEELDEWAAARPTILRQVSGHSCVASAAALRIAGITRETADPPGGRIVRDECGEPTGLFEENAMGLIYVATPKPTRDQMLEAILRCAESMHRYGITAACDMSTGQYNLADELWAYEKASERSPGVRFGLYPLWSRVFEEDGRPKVREFPESDSLRVSGVKLFSDGALGSATAAIYGEYRTGGDGMLIYEPHDLRRRVKIAADAGFRVSVHAIGDRAVDVVLDAFEAAGNPSMHRLEHAMLLSDQQIERIKRLDVPITMQPEFLLEFGHAYRRRLGPERASKLKPLRSLLDAGVRVALSSDRPIVGGDPWMGVEAATNRPEGFDPSENISRNEAVRLYTQSGADMDGWNFGSLATGQLADFCLRDE